MRIENYLYASKPTVITQAKSGGADFASILNAKLNVPESMDDIFERASAKYDVPVNLLKAVGKAESNFNPSAVSRCGAQGVMQLMPGTAAGLGVTDAFNAEQNIMGGASYLKQMLDRYDGDAKLALAAYNAGCGNVDKYGGIPPFEETRNYVNKVLEYAGQSLSADGYVFSATEASPSSKVHYTLQTEGEFDEEDYSLFVKLMRLSLESSLTGSVLDVSPANYFDAMLRSSYEG